MDVSHDKVLENIREFVEQEHFSCIPVLILVHIENIESDISGCVILFHGSLQCFSLNESEFVGSPSSVVLSQHFLFIMKSLFVWFLIFFFNIILDIVDVVDINIGPNALVKHI
mgnify:CR=1 FL=1|jgi:hypothetical protein